MITLKTQEKPFMSCITDLWWTMATHRWIAPAGTC